ARQHEKGRLTARERIAKLIDPDTSFFELGLWAAWRMYTEWGSAPSAGVVTGIGTLSGRRVMVIANDATVKAGAFFPMTCNKLLMTEGSGLYLAGPALVKAAIGQNVSHDDLGGAHMHAAISGTIDFREADDAACLERLRRLVAALPADPKKVAHDLPSGRSVA